MDLEERAADPLAGGLMRGYQCGMIWGAVLAAGVHVYHLYGPGARSEAMALSAARELADAFKTGNKYIDCRDITRIDLSTLSLPVVLRYLIKTAPRGTCFGMAARYARTAYSKIDHPLAVNEINPQSDGVSCAALLAHTMGETDLHAVMVSGFAGGLGLSGSACGALGAAIWFSGIKTLKTGAKAIGYKDPEIMGIMERFTQTTGQEFECVKITGRKFSCPEDHASFIHGGGCAELIQALAKASR